MEFTFPSDNNNKYDFRKNYQNNILMHNQNKPFFDFNNNNNFPFLQQSELVMQEENSVDFKKDELGNIVGINISEDNLINETDSLDIIKLKEAAQLEEALRRINSGEIYNPEEISNVEEIKPIENQEIEQGNTSRYGAYNEEVGNRLAQAAHNVQGTVGYCLTGVADTIDAIYGAGAFPPIMSACDAADILAADTGLGAHFSEISVNREDLPNLPAGAIVVWDNNKNGGGSNVTDAGRIHGHISIALGDGRESSDHITSQIVDRDANFRVFVPIS